MRKRKNNNPAKAASKKEKELQALYEKYRREFSAADLQKYTEIEEGIPFEKVIGECEEIYRKHRRRKT